MLTHHIPLGRPCTADGVFLAPGVPPTPPPPKSHNDWSPYRNDIEFATAEFAFKQRHMSNAAADTLFDLMAALLAKHNDSPPFADHKDLHQVIDATQLGDVPWQGFLVQYTGERPENAPSWMDDEYDVWYRDPHLMAHNMLANPTYKKEIDYTPFHFMSGDWAWQQAASHSYIFIDEISKDPNTHGSAFVPIILGSDKTTVSVGTGNNEYYPLYASIGNVHNNVRRAHRDALVIIGFLAIPKTNRKDAKEDIFRNFHRQLFHCSLSAILASLKPGMTQYEVLRCGDNHFRRIIYGLGPYIADYEEQIVLSCTVKNWCPKCLALQLNLDGGGIYRSREHTDLMISELPGDTLWFEYGPFTNDFPRADIHQLLSFDLLHQLIKGAFKDHLVDWVVKYLRITHSTKRGDEIMSDIDRRIAAVASFSGLWRFHEGRDFRQWTWNDSKALMKVFIPEIEGHVPQEMVCAFRALLEFCFLMRRNIITEDTMKQIQDALTRFHHYRQIFETSGTVPHFSLPRQHSMIHYHIKAVKDPWRWSSKNNALGQMLLCNQRLDKLAASRVDFATRGMLNGSVLSRTVAALYPAEVPVVRPQTEDEADDGEIVKGSTVLAFVRLAKTPHNVPHLRRLIRYFLFTQLFPDDPRDPEDIPTAIFNSAAATFYAPSDPSGVGGMRREQICACPLWQNVYACNDCIFISTNPDLEGMRGLDVVRVYPCVLIQWFDKISDCADEDTGMWMVKPGVLEDGSPNLSVIHIDTVYRAAHLIPVYGPEFIPHTLKFYHSYDVFRSFYVNKYADHHAFEIVS
ncbi:hypothetical protein F4604DRAFT_1886122 [Suillus subluteus]|nr:hypothetical protein F4604DRAFT_1886122 [Suillus subluteus]